MLNKLLPLLCAGRNTMRACVPLLKAWLFLPLSLLCQNGAPVALILGGAGVHALSSVRTSVRPPR